MRKTMVVNVRDVCCVSEDIVRAMKDQVNGQTDEALMPQFGISYNTWRKIRSGTPVRRSVAERLERRVKSGAGETRRNA